MPVASFEKHGILYRLRFVVSGYSFPGGRKGALRRHRGNHENHLRSLLAFRFVRGEMQGDFSGAKRADVSEGGYGFIFMHIPRLSIFFEV